jgi:hypothetical protein
MEPTFLPGEQLTAVRKWRPVRAGDVVVLQDPRNPERWMLKRCLRRVGRMADVRGDNEQASTDSRDFGLIPTSSIHFLVVGVQ